MAERLSGIIMDVTKRKCSFDGDYLTGPKGTCPSCTKRLEKGNN